MNQGGRVNGTKMFVKEIIRCLYLTIPPLKYSLVE